jgi:GAF domain-containing protein
VIVPVISQGRVIGSLSLDAIDRTREFTQDEIELSQAFAAQIVPILQTVQQNGAEQKALSQLMTMHKISNYIQAADDLDKMLHVVLTSITAGFGQGFNRAALFLLDPKREALVGRLGIGHFEPAAAYEDWGRIQREGLNNFDVYLQLLEQDAFHLTPVGERIDKLRLNFDPHDRDLFTRVIQTGRHHLVREDELAQLPALFQETFEPSRPMIIVPLLAQEQAIGLLVADNKFTQAPITHDLVDSLVTVVNTAAVVIEKARLFAEMKLAREKLRAFYVASNTLISSPNPQKMLDDIVEQLRKAAGASGVSMLIIDPDGRVQNIITAGSDEAMPLTELIRPDGLSMAVMRSGQPTAFEDADRQPERVNPAVFQRNIVAALCLPLSLEGKRFGVMWIHYDRPHHFPEFEVDALKLFVNQAAIAYDHARQLDRLETIRQAAAALASVSGLSNTLDQIVQSATKVLGADSTAIFTYHVVKDRLYFQDRTSDNIPIEHKPSFQKAEPSRGKVVDTVLAERWVGVEDLNQPDRYPFAGRTSRRLLKQINEVSFQAVALAVGDE